MPSIPAPENPVTFAAPPLDEVVLGVQWRQDVTDDAFALADYWPAIRAQYPGLDKHPALPPVDEDFGPPRMIEPQIQVLSGPPAPRYWFISRDETRLIQLQPDRLLYNWRRREKKTTYPRYTKLRREFSKVIEQYHAALPAQKRDAASPAWCEVSYINHLPAAGSKSQHHIPVSKLLKLVASPRLTMLDEPEDSQLQQRYLLTDHGQAEGRFYVTVAPAYRRADDEPIYVLTLLARLQPREPTADGVIEALDRGRHLVVQTFKEITTTRAHKAWGLQDD